MLQSIAVRPRLYHLLSVAIVAFGALALLSMPRLNLAPAPAPAEPPAAVVQAAVVPAAPVHNLATNAVYVTGDLVGDASPSEVARVAASNAAYSEHGCGAGAGAYVTGDMVGDASPAAVYATLCGR